MNFGALVLRAPGPFRAILQSRGLTLPTIIMIVLSAGISSSASAQDDDSVYIQSTTGYCPAGNNPITDLVECENAAAELGLSDTTAYDFSSDHNPPDRPQGCYWNEATNPPQLAFNRGNFDPTLIDGQRFSICRESDVESCPQTVTTVTESCFTGIIPHPWKLETAALCSITPASAPGVPMHWCHSFYDLKTWVCPIGVACENELEPGLASGCVQSTDLGVIGCDGITCGDGDFFGGPFAEIPGWNVCDPVQSTWVPNPTVPVGTECCLNTLGPGGPCIDHGWFECSLGTPFCCDDSFQNPCPDSPNYDDPLCGSFEEVCESTTEYTTVYTDPPAGFCDCAGALTEDCAGECGGTAATDNCNVCDSNPTNDCVLDCAGTWGGTAALDQCGVCDTNPANDCTQDCAGAWGGTASLDGCGVCDSDPTNNCIQDCEGTWGGTATRDCRGVCEGNAVVNACGDCWDDIPSWYACLEDCTGGVPNLGLDQCGVCDSDPTNNCTQDCEGTWGGTAVLDPCDFCTTNPADDCAHDCEGTPGGTATRDECGVCDMNSANDCTQDCNDHWGGSATQDECGVCDTNPANDCTQDCNDNWGGTAALDQCNVCQSDPTNNCTQDCAGTWGGTATMDCAGNCEGTASLDQCGVCDTNPANDCTQDCAGTWGGTATVDECGLYHFENGTVADAEEVNANFTALVDRLNTALSNRETDCVTAGGTWGAGTSTCTPGGGAGSYSCFIGGFCTRLASIGYLTGGGGLYHGHTQDTPPASDAGCNEYPGNDHWYFGSSLPYEDWFEPLKAEYAYLCQ